MMIDLTVDEWTQREFMINKQMLAQQGVKVVLVDTILNPIEGVEVVVYSPPLLKLEPSGSVLVFYCDTGKALSLIHI